MRIETWDTGFVRARRRDVHLLTGLPLERFGEWWPGLRARPLGDGRVEWRLRAPGLGRRPYRVVATLIKCRPNLGVSFRLDGDLVGEAEFFYVDEPNGVVVHHLLRADARGGARRARRLTRDHRALAREALHALKDRCEGGRLPGSEPDPDLLEHQRLAIEEYRAGVEAHARKTAAAGASERDTDPGAAD